jgi:hypothetical protein
LLAFSGSLRAGDNSTSGRRAKEEQHKDENMKLDDIDLREPELSDRAWNREVEAFLATAVEGRFEMRYFGEDRWYPVPADDVALTLAGYHPDLGRCLDRLLNGEEVASRLARFRLSPRTLR